MAKPKFVITQVNNERRQSHPTRQGLYSQVEKLLGIPVVSFFTSFRHPVMIDDSDSDLLEGVLQKCDYDKGFAMLLNSPGGDGLAAERIINICRTYSGTGKYKVIVPGKAKSAATMICLGASEIIMTETAELGAVDPQVVIEEDGDRKIFSVYNLVTSYEDLFNRAIKEKGNLQPYLQQLSNYDEREISEYKSVMELSEDITVTALKTGMLSSVAKSQIKNKVKIFLNPEKVKVHGRPIYSDEAIKASLEVKIIDLKEKKWAPLYELYARLDDFVSSGSVAKSLECKDFCFTVSVRNKR